MTEIKVMCAIGLFCISLSWALQSAPMAATHLEERVYQSYRAENQKQVDEAVRLDLAEQQAAINQ